jgi:hypothetical protein
LEVAFGVPLRSGSNISKRIMFGLKIQNTTIE